MKYKYFKQALLFKVDSELKIEKLSTEVTDEDLKDAVIDEYGVKYSRDGTKLLEGLCNTDVFVVRNGVKVICNMACWAGGNSKIIIPNGVIYIGDCAFAGYLELTSVIIPDSVISMGEGTFFGCEKLSSISISKNLVRVGKGTFCGCDSLPSSIKEELVSRFGKEVFEL